MIYRLRHIVGPSVANHLQRVQENIKELLSHLEYLDPELIHIISKYDNGEPLTRWLREYDAEPMVTRYGKIDPQQRDISSYSKSFYEIHKTMRSLDTYWNNRFAKHPTVMRSMLSAEVSYLNQNEAAIKLARRLIRYPEHKKDALFLSIVAYLRLNQIAKAQIALNKYSKLGEGYAESAITSIKRHYKVPSDRLARLKATQN